VLKEAWLWREHSVGRVRSYVEELQGFKGERQKPGTMDKDVKTLKTFMEILILIEC